MGKWIRDRPKESQPRSAQKNDPCHETKPQGCAGGRIELVMVWIHKYCKPLYYKLVNRVSAN